MNVSFLDVCQSGRPVLDPSNLVPGFDGPDNELPSPPLPLDMMISELINAKDGRRAGGGGAALANLRELGFPCPYKFGRQVLRAAIARAQVAYVDCETSQNRKGNLAKVALEVAAIQKKIKQMRSNYNSIGFIDSKIVEIGGFGHLQDYTTRNMRGSYQASLASVLDNFEIPYLEALDRFSIALDGLDRQGKPLTSMDCAKAAFAYQFGIFWYSMFRKLPPTAGRDTVFVRLLERAGETICEDERIAWSDAAKNAAARHQDYLRAGDMFAWARMDCLVIGARPTGDTVRLESSASVRRPNPAPLSMAAFSSRKK